ncbi:MAG: 23S rRNA (guanosine(2251)-2'-O)-methyltransferase RlmB [Saprospiraceae bacterium]
MIEKSEWILGKNALKEAIAAGTLIQKVYLSETLEKETLHELIKACRAENISVLTVPKFKLDKLSRLQHQGVLAHISPIAFYKTADLVDMVYSQGKTPCLALLDGITDVRNFGAIARSAEVFGVHGIVIGQRNSAPVNLEAIKSSSGALLRIPICKDNNLVHTIKELRKTGFRLIGADEKADSTLDDMEMNQPIVFIFGSEGEGISKELKMQIDIFVKIPQEGQIASLNVSVSAGIFFYEWMKRKTKK